jgi:cobalamin biosynthesis Mg chelatase CobN
MLETPHQTSRLARRGLVPLAVSALLAFALVPGLALAQDTGGAQYYDAPPTVTGKTSDGGSANRSNTGGGGDGSDQSSTRSGSTADGKSKDGADDDQAGAAGGKDGGKGGAAGGNAGGEKAGDDGAAVLGTDPAGSSTDDGGSSPLVPILIALAVLAAISVGVVAMRKKREDVDPGAPASPEAG